MSDIDIRHRDRRRRETLHRISYVACGIPVVVMKGFVSDGASIPRLCWSIVGCPDTFLYEALLHDWLYMTGTVSRKQADEWFRRLLIIGGVGKTKAQAMYLAVRMFGGGRHGD